MILIQNTKISLNNPFSTSIKSGYSKYKNNKILNLSFSPVYRDIIDNTQSFSNFELKLISFDSYINLENKQLYLKEFDIFKLKSISPTSYLLQTWSFAGQVGAKENDFTVDNRKQFIFNVMGGKAFEVWNFKPYFLVGGEYLNNLHGIWEVGMIFNFTRYDKTVISYNSNFIDYKYNVKEAIYLSDKMAIITEYEKIRNHEHNKEYKNYNLGVKVYF